jgi:multiple sugar transport system ATP-binding protein
MVFQNYALYPHMSVADNMGFALKMQGVSKDDRAKRVAEAAKLLGLEDYLDRKPKALSGGQRQRVAMGRAIVRNPQVFLMDEPLSNLDAKLRVQTRTQIAELQQRLGVTTVYVTHDQVEAMTMGDRVAVLKDGLLQQVDTPLNLYDGPKNKFVAGFIGSPAMNLLDADLVEGGAKLGDYVVPVDRNILAKAGNDKTLTLGVRPEAFKVSDHGLPVKVAVIEELGADAFLYGTAEHNNEHQQIVARIDARMKVEKGSTIHLAAEPDKLHLFSTSTEERLTA